MDFCTRGSECLFSHDLKAEACKHFVGKGYCNDGDNCKYGHFIPTENSNNADNQIPEDNNVPGSSATTTTETPNPISSNSSLSTLLDPNANLNASPPISTPSSSSPTITNQHLNVPDIPLLDSNYPKVNPTLPTQPITNLIQSRLHPNPSNSNLIPQPNPSTPKPKPMVNPNPILGDLNSSPQLNTPNVNSNLSNPRARNTPTPPQKPIQPINPANQKSIQPNTTPANLIFPTQTPHQNLPTNTNPPNLIALSSNTNPNPPNQKPAHSFPFQSDQNLTLPHQDQKTGFLLSKLGGNLSNRFPSISDVHQMLENSELEQTVNIKPITMTRPKATSIQTTSNNNSTNNNTDSDASSAAGLLNQILTNK